MNSSRACYRPDGLSLGLIALAVVLVLSAAIPGPAAAWEIGHRFITWTDPDRGNRQIGTHVYYPADTPGDNVPIGGGGEVQFPVAVFGHGYIMVYSAYENIWTSLVPEGYIVALPTTEGNLFPSHLNFGLDISFLADAIREDGSDPASPFFGAVAQTAVVMGHSMGGGASVLAASQNPTITAVANLAAANTNPSAIDAAANVTAEALMFAGSLDCVTPPQNHQIPIYENLSSECRTLITITGASHCQFAEYNYFCSLGEGGCDDPTITRTQQHAIVDHFLLPWLDAVLKDDLAAWDLFQQRLDESTQVTHEQDCPAPASAPVLAGHWSGGLTAYPNPFREDSAIRFHAAGDGPVRMEIFDASGRLVRGIPAWPAASGIGEIVWDGRQESGREAPAGVYFLRLIAPEGRSSGTIIRVE